jgi:hypothetical protein
VSCQDRVAMAATMSTNDTAFDTTEDSTEVKAC